MKYSIAEANHSKSVSVVEINDTGDVKITEIPLRPKKDLRIITGSFKEIMERSDSGSREDYVVVRLTDVLGLYEPMNRLRERYPNIIHLERVNSSVAQNSVFSAGREKKDDLELFLQFYKVVTERDVAPAAMDVISDAIKSVVEAEA
jgi:exonuclease SbcD